MRRYAIVRVPLILAVVIAFQTLGEQACRTLPSPSPTSTPTPGPTQASCTASVASDGTRFCVETILTNLQVPWSVAFSPDGRIFVAERPGRVLIAENGRVLPNPALTIADVVAQGESGALGLTLHPAFAENHLVYLVYTARSGNGAVNRLVRYREVGNTLGERVVLIDNMAAGSIHDGSRVRFGPDRKLYVTMGDAAVPSIAQDVASLNGKVLRLNEDGTTPGDNPYPSPVYTIGHRNPQGIDWQPATGDLWETEHGATGNDEVNRLAAGSNYGWPRIEGTQTTAGMLPPQLVFSPSVAPSGASFYTGTQIPSFRHDLFFATLRGEHLHRVRFDPANPRRIVSDERLLEGRFGRLRDVQNGPGGYLYFTTSNRDGRGSPIPEDDRLLRLVPAR